jgi:hypothetical protein
MFTEGQLFDDTVFFFFFFVDRGRINFQSIFVGYAQR